MALLKTIAEKRETLEMLKKRIINLVIAIAMLVAVVGGSGIVADELGFAMTGQAYACGCGGGHC
jgi:hypothetical protein